MLFYVYYFAKIKLCGIKCDFAGRNTGLFRPAPRRLREWAASFLFMAKS